MLIEIEIHFHFPPRLPCCKLLSLPCAKGLKPPYLSASRWLTSPSFIGTLIGILLAVVFGVMFVKGSVRINLQRFFRVTTVILIFVAGQLVVSGLHELSENGVLPSSRGEMAVIGPIVRNDLFFFVTILALAALMILFDQRRRQDAEAQLQNASDSRALQRKAQWSARKERLWSTAVYTSSFIFIVLVTAQFIYAKSTTSLSPARTL